MTECTELGCEEFLANLYEFVDGELDVDVQGRLRSHIASCPDCSSVADVEVHLREVMRSACMTQAPEHLRRSIELRLSQLTASRS